MRWSLVGPHRWICLNCPAARRPKSFSSSARPFRVAIIGSGPAGFYTAQRIMTRVPDAKVDMYESLPVPYGLVRFGVAPDHPEVKNCQNKFHEVASSPNFTFIGNVSVGQQSPRANGNTAELSAVLDHYDAVTFAYGASKDRTLGIPGESTLRGIHSARHFVGWYNGAPEYADLEFDLSTGDEAVIIGQGNVALDVARMLLSDVGKLRETDISERAAAELARSRVRRVHIVGRRGPMQAAFTIKELRELMQLSHVAFHPVDSTLIPKAISDLPRPSRRLMGLLQSGSATPVANSPRSWSLDFCLAPKHFIAQLDDPSAVGSTMFGVTRLSSTFDPRASAHDTGETLTLDSPLVFRSIGYKAVPLTGFTEAGIQFDDHIGILKNDGQGRVLRLVRESGKAAAVTRHIAGLYCAGWVKRGPTGVIASTMADAFATADAVIHDWLSGRPFLHHGRAHSPQGWEGLKHDTNGANSWRVVHWKDWERIDKVELEMGQRAGKIRRKFTDTAEMLAVLSGS